MKPRYFTILIVDDNPDDRIIFQRWLTRESNHTYRFLEAATVDDGLAALRSESVDCILLDYWLTGETGIELLEQIHMLPDRLPVGIIMLTGQGTESIAVEAMKKGAHDYLAKGQITPQSLVEVVTNTIERILLERYLEERRRDIQLTNEAFVQSLRQLEEIEHAARASVFHAISEILIDVNLNYNDLLKSITRRVTELVGDVCFITLAHEHPPSTELVALDYPGIESSSTLQRMGDTLESQFHELLGAHVAKTHEPLLLSSISHETISPIIAPCSFPIHNISVQSIIVVPVRIWGRVIGALGVSRTTVDHPYTMHEQHLLQDLASRLQLVIENSGMYVVVQRELESLREIKRDRERFFELMTDLLAIIGDDFSFRPINPAWRTLLGYSNDDLPHCSFISLIHPEDAPVTRAILEQSFRDGQKHRFVARMIQKPGNTYRPIDWCVGAFDGERQLYAVGSSNPPASWEHKRPSYHI